MPRPDSLFALVFTRCYHVVTQCEHEEGGEIEVEERIRQRREALGLSQADAARKAGVTRGYWCMIESGERTPERYPTLQLIAATLEWSVDELFASEEGVREQQAKEAT